MTYRIEGLKKDRFEPLFALTEDELETRGAQRVVATAQPGFPCRVSLCDAEVGERLLLVHYVSHDVPTPFRSGYALYVREAAREALPYADAVPAMLDRRTLGLRGFDAEGMLRGALLAMPGEADERIRELFGHPEIATIHAHNAAHGCFLAKVERD